MPGPAKIAGTNHTLRTFPCYLPTRVGTQSTCPRKGSEGLVGQMEEDILDEEE